MIVRSSSHTLRFANTGKREEIFKLLAEWRRVMQLICDDVWLNGYTWMEDDVFHEFNRASSSTHYRNTWTTTVSR